MQSNSHLNTEEKKSSENEVVGAPTSSPTSPLDGLSPTFCSTFIHSFLCLWHYSWVFSFFKHLIRGLLSSLPQSSSSFGFPTLKWLSDGPPLNSVVRDSFRVLETITSGRNIGSIPKIYETYWISWRSYPSLQAEPMIFMNAGRRMHSLWNFRESNIRWIEKRLSITPHEMRILVIDDEKVSRIVIQRLLEKAGYRSTHHFLSHPLSYFPQLLLVSIPRLYLKITISRRGLCRVGRRGSEGVAQGQHQPCLMWRQDARYERTWISWKGTLPAITHFPPIFSFFAPFILCSVALKVLIASYSS